MASNSMFLLTVCAAATLPFVASAQEASKARLTARELFYQAAQSPAATPPKQAQPAAPRPAKKSEAPESARSKKAESAEAARSPNKIDPAGNPPQPLPAAAVVIPASANSGKAAAGQPLGLRYSILKKTGDRAIEVPTDTVFHAGDRIQIKIEPNLAGYLYIISQGSSGTWKPIFPSSEVADGNNRIESMVAYTMPPKSNIVFDEQTGTEKLFIVFSREPEPNLERMVYSLQETGPTATPKKDAPAAPKQLMLAANVNIDDKTVGNLRTVYARDLIIEKVDENTPGDKQKETAVYVVNPSGSMDSRVVADLRLVHQ